MFLHTLLLSRLIHGVSIETLASLFNVDYRTAKAAFVDLTMFEDMKVRLMQALTSSTTKK